MITRKYAVASFGILSALLFTGGGSALAARKYATLALGEGASTPLLISGSIYCFLATLCAVSALLLSRPTLKAGLFARSTSLLLTLVVLADSYRDFKNGLSVDGIMEFIVLGTLLAIIAIHLAQKKQSAAI